ncbi:MAG: glycosyltransferase family 2 protein [Ruminococcus sp.]|nr:glycosyltransferase family 2 protein [Ruminococcus sp.]
MATLSLCMIVRDEAPVLARCLNCIKHIMDEIIIIDTGSHDNTKEIARQYTELVYDFAWNDNFSDARNFAFSKASCDYQMWLDADDVIDAENQQKLLNLKQTLCADVVMMPYHIAFDEQDNPVYTYYRERILKRSRNFRWKGAVHEAVTPSGEIIYSEIAVQHRKLQINDPDRNLRIFEKLIAENSPLCARDTFYYANELYYHQQYQKAVQIYLDFLALPDGWKENQIDACQKLSACYLALDDSQTALKCLFQSFLYDRPRAEICCDIGRIKMLHQNWNDAVFWYETALNAPLPAEQQGFSVPDCHDYIPYMQLCVCYDRMRNFPKARAYNEKAGRIKPKDAGYLYNQNYFREILKEECDR